MLETCVVQTTAEVHKLLGRVAGELLAETLDERIVHFVSKASIEGHLSVKIEELVALKVLVCLNRLHVGTQEFTEDYLAGISV